MPIPTPRRRGISGKKASYKRYQTNYGSERQVSPEAFKLAEERFFGYNKPTNTLRKALFYAVQRLSHYDNKQGAKLPQRAFSSEKIGRIIQEGIVECGLAICIDPDSWKPTNGNIQNAIARSFIPNWELLLADTGRNVVSTYADYCANRYKDRPPLHEESQLFLPCAASGVKIPSKVINYLQNGTGLYCDFDILRSLLLDLSEAERSSKLCNAFGAVGRIQIAELRPLWEQHKWGRLYSSKPAVMNMPKILLSALRSLDGLPIFNVDFTSYELRIACNICKQTLPEDDIYQLLGEPCGISRERVKQIINPMLHGQTWQQCYFGQPFSHVLADRRKVEKQLQRFLPRLIDGLEKLRSNPALLQIHGAQVFFRCMAEAIEQCAILAGGIPKHDGWVFAASESQALAVCEVFKTEAKRLTGVCHPVKIEQIL